jgi:hypothetical protein
MRYFLCSILFIAACGDDSSPTDAGARSDSGRDGGSRDGGRPGSDAGGTDAGAMDGGGTDGGASDGGTDAGRRDAGAPIDASSCEIITAQAADFLEANKGCSTAEDCVQVGAGCYPRQEDCCVVYMNTGFDAAAWDDYLDALGECAGGACACCAAIPAPPDCIEGRCMPAR